MSALFERERLPALARRALLVGLAGLALAVGLSLVGFGRFWLPYLFAFQLCLGLSLGASAILMIHHLSGGRWGWVVRRPLEAMAASLPLVALLALPLLLGMEALYPWLGPDPREELWRAKEPWLERGFFLARAAGYLVVWSALALALARGSRRRDPDAKGGAPRRLGRLAAAGLVLHVFTVGFAAIDWLASLEPTWYSSIFGFHVAAAQTLGAMALIVALACAAAMALRERAEEVGQRLNELGNLLLVLVVLDAWLAFSQYFIVWNGDLPHHAVWYAPRSRGLWRHMGTAMILLQFALPFAALLFRPVKRDPRRLLAVASVVLVGRVVDGAWFVLPSAEPPAPADLAVAAAAALGLGGLWSAAFLWQCRRRLEVAA